MRTGSPVSLSVLDALRGLAALYVMLSHARSFLWIGQREFAATGEHGLPFVAAAASASLVYAHQAVCLFFLISGFCIHYRQAKALSQRGPGVTPDSGFNLKSFARRRFKRLYPTLLVALGLTVLFDKAGLLINPAFYNERTWYPSPDFSVTTIVGNLLVQGGLAVPVLGDNVPLWSLSWEFWFYAMYPVVLLMSARAGSLTPLGLSALLSLALLVAQPAFAPQWILSVLTYWVVWVMGATLAEAYAGRLRIRGLRVMAPFAGVAAVVLVIVLSMRHIQSEQGVTVPMFDDARIDVLLSGTFGILLAFAMLGMPTRGVRIVEGAARRMGMLGDISYSLYVVHYPLLLLISAWWLTGHNRLPQGVELAIPGAVVALGAGWMCWYMVERHCVSSTSVSRARRAPQPMVVVGPSSGSQNDFELAVNRSRGRATGVR